MGCWLTGNGCNFEGSPPFENANLHRNVIYKGNKFTVEPFTRLKSVNPEKLWSWMDDLRDRGVDTIAIPHNSNGSNGQMFEMENWEGLPISTQYAEFRMRNEPLVEMTQVKALQKHTQFYRQMMNGLISKLCGNGLEILHIADLLVVM